MLTEAAFVEYALEQKPDLLVFSLYLWNIEKSFRIAGTLRKLISGLTILYGGPEVNADNEYLLTSEHFEFGISGEGEIPFSHFLAGKPTDKIAGYLTKDSYNDFAELRTDYKDSTNPYFANLVETKPDSTMFFETVRGCPFTCNFCYYNKSYDKIVPIGHKQLDFVFKYARENDFDELFILDPTFNVQPNFNDLLDKMIELNKDHYFEIATEIRADFLKDHQIEKFEKLNLIEAEIGLQTTNPEALVEMDRKDKIAETIERTQRMLKSNVTCKVDLIVGLPGDTLAGFKKSVDDVKAANVSDEVQVFRLSILSGTEYSVNREKLGLDTQRLPPYYMHSSPTFSEADIREALDYAEEVFEISLYPISPYLLSTDFSNLESCTFVEWDSDIEPFHKIIVEKPIFDLDFIESIKSRLCESLVLHFIITDINKQKNAIVDAMNWFSENYRLNTYQFIFDFRCDAQLDFVEELVTLLPQRETSYLDRDATANLGYDFNLTCRMALIVSDQFRSSSTYVSLVEKYDMFLRVINFNPELIEECFENHNLYFCDASQEESFEYLTENDLIDDFTLFESFMYELKKEEEQPRLYQPTTLHL